MHLHSVHVFIIDMRHIIYLDTLLNEGDALPKGQSGSGCLKNPLMELSALQQDNSKAVAKKLSSLSFAML